MKQCQVTKYSLCLCEIRICLFLIFEFAKLPDNNICVLIYAWCLSRCVEEDEVGSIFALISVISAISSSLMTAAYQAIYARTIETFPAAFLVINSSMLLLTIPNNFVLKKKL